MTAPATCPSCARPRCTPADLERWEREFGKGGIAPDPAWAKAICWTKAESTCLRRKVS